MKIGNILTKTDLKLDSQYNVVSSLDEIIEGIPTLIHGYHLANEISNSDLKFLDRKLSENVYWTFTIDEDRKHHIIDLDNFKDLCFKNLVDNVTYFYIDPIQFSKQKIKKVLAKLYTVNNAITFISNDNMIYIYSDNIIFGIDLKLFKFIGLKTDKIKSRIKAKSLVFLERSEILIEYKEYLERLDGQHKYIPLLYSIRNNE
jgi:hypothetical protein